MFYCKLVWTRTLSADNGITDDVITHLSITLHIIRTLSFLLLCSFFIGFDFEY